MIRRARTCKSGGTGRHFFLNRDGVINGDRGYTHKVQDLRWVPGTIDLIRSAKDPGALVIVVANQAGLARGYYEMCHLDTFHLAIQDDLAAVGAYLDKFYVCPYHRVASVVQWRHPDRKPKPRMLKTALGEWHIDATTSVPLGDQPTDLAAAQSAGVHALLFKLDERDALRRAIL